MTTTIPGSFLLKIINEPSVSFACDMAACGRECVTFGGKTVIVTPELKLFPRTFTRKGLPHSEFKSRLMVIVVQLVGRLGPAFGHFCARFPV